MSNIIIGVGETGSKITLDIINKINIDYILIKNKKTVECNPNYIEIEIPKLLNPSASKIRQSLNIRKEEIISKVKHYSSVTIVGNLSSRFGIAVLPMIAKLLKEMQKEVVCIVILPFGFEKEKIFRCGTSLSFLQTYSDSVIIADNDMFLKSRDDSDIYECFEITNTAIKDILLLFFENYFPSDLNLISSSNTKTSLENMLIEILSRVINKLDPDKINQTFIYLSPSKEKFNNIQPIIESTRKILDKSYVEINLITKNKEALKMHMVVGTKQNCYYNYDPINEIIPKRNILDFEPEISLPETMEIIALKNIE